MRIITWLYRRPRRGCRWLLGFSVTSYLRDEASAVITDHLSQFVLISSHSAPTPASRELKAECVRLVVTSRLHSFQWSRRRDKDGSRAAEKWRAGQELPCNLIPLCFAFIHSLSWQITLQWEEGGQDDEWGREKGGGRERESVCVCVCVCVCDVMIHCL